MTSASTSGMSSTLRTSALVFGVPPPASAIIAATRADARESTSQIAVMAVPGVFRNARASWPPRLLTPMMATHGAPPCTRIAGAAETTAGAASPAPSVAEAVFRNERRSTEWAMAPIRYLVTTPATGNGQAGNRIDWF